MKSLNIKNREPMVESPNCSKQKQPQNIPTRKKSHTPETHKTESKISSETTSILIKQGKKQQQHKTQKWKPNHATQIPPRNQQQQLKRRIGFLNLIHRDPIKRFFWPKKRRIIRPKVQTETEQKQPKTR